MSNELFKAFARVTIGNREYTTDTATIKFSTSYKIGKPAATVLTIFNVNKEGIAAAGEKDARVIIEAGYQGSKGLCVLGQVISFDVTGSPDRQLKIKIGDNTKLWRTARVVKAYGPGTTASFIISDVLASFGIAVENLEVATDKVYAGGLNFSGEPLDSVLKKLARDTGSVHYFRNSQAAFLPAPSKGKQPVIVLNKDSGLLRIRKTDKGYKAKTLFLYSVGVGSVMRIESKEFDGFLRVTNGKSLFNSTGKGSTEFEAKAL